MRRPEDLLPLTPLSLAILLALGAGALHGYGIIKAVEQQSEKRLRPGAGSLYAALDRLAASGLIEEQRFAGDGGSARRRFGLTSFGRRVALAELRRLERLIEGARGSGFAPESVR